MSYKWLQMTKYVLFDYNLLNKNKYAKFIRLVQNDLLSEETLFSKFIVNCVFCKHLVEYGLILGDRMMMIVASGEEHHHLILNVGLTSFLF